jgi:hypothetical protein
LRICKPFSNLQRLNKRKSARRGLEPRRCTLLI